MPIIYGILPSPPTRSAILTAKMVGVECTLKKVDMLKLEHKSDEFLKISPTHSIPAFEDDDGFRIFDSHAIVTYIVSKYAKDDSLYPKDLQQRSLVDSMLHFNNAGLWSSILGHFVVSGIFGKPYDPDREALFKDRLSTLDMVLGQRAYAAGARLTVADLCLVNSLSAPTIAGFTYDPYPNIKSWLEKMKKEIPFYDEVVTRGTEELKEYFKAASHKYQTLLANK